jgi:hypothetical protein
MTIDSAKLIIECQFALRTTQEKLGELLGKSKRTIQRWQDKGCVLLPEQADTLAKALRRTRPDLADQVLALGAKTAASLGRAPATPEVIDAILRAAAKAGHTSPKAVRPAVQAAFAKAAEVGVTVNAVVAGMTTERT